MKNIILLMILIIMFITSNIYSQGIIFNLSNGKKIEISSRMSSERMCYNDALKFCDSIGKGWRIPTTYELKEMFLNKDKIGGFVEQEKNHWAEGYKSAWYWTSTPGECYADNKCLLHMSIESLSSYPESVKDGPYGYGNWIRPVKDYNINKINNTPNNSQTSTNSTTTNSPATDRYGNKTSSNSTSVSNTTNSSKSSNTDIGFPCNVKSVNIDAIETCNSCRGTGQVNRQSSSVCPNCENWNSEYRRKVACHVCKDTRKNPNIKTWKETCTECKGNGRDYEQEKRNRDFGGYDQRIIKGIYNGTLGNAFEYRSISIEHREKNYGIQTEFNYSKWSTGCSCLGSEWSLPNRGELVLIMNDLQSSGVHGNGQYATNETKIVGDFKSKHIWVVDFGQSINQATKMLSTDNRLNDNYGQLRCKVICIKRK
jgi:hypothetical protein